MMPIGASLLALHARALLHRLARDQRGQAMVEYSTITFFLLIGTAGLGFAFKWPGMNVSLAQAIYSALQVYVDSYYYSLHLLVP